MQTKNIYCGDGWEFQILKDDKDFYLKLTSKATPIKKWELTELRDFLTKYLEGEFPDPV